MPLLELPLEICNTLWIGGDLGPVSNACLSSFVRHGHRVVLHCYDVPRDVPRGVEVSDAAQILSSGQIVRHKATGSYALFSNFFRYELMRLKRGLWIDCDVYCVRPIVRTGDYVFGWQTPTSINGAILRMPPDGLALKMLLSIFTRRSPILPWMSPQEQSEFAARKQAGEDFDLGDLPWGVAGPRALTHIFEATGLSQYARVPRVFYPVPSHKAPMLLMQSDLAQMIAPDTLTVHLWNEELRKHLDRRLPGSPIDRLMKGDTLFDESRIPLRVA